MAMRKVSFVLAVVALIVCVCDTASSTPVSQIVYTGDLFSTRPGSVRLCAQVYPPVAGVPVVFYGTTAWGIQFQFCNPVYTDITGRACKLANIFAESYWVRACVGPDRTENGCLTKVLTVFSPLNTTFHGVAAGGAVYIGHNGVWPNLTWNSRWREATFGLLAKLNQPGNFRLLYADPLAETYIQAQTYNWSNVGANFAEFRGPAWYSLDTPDIKYGTYYVLVANGPGYPRFSIWLYDAFGDLIYQSAVIPDENRVFNGQVLFP